MRQSTTRNREALDPPRRRQRTLEAGTRLVRRESQVQPLVVVFEDLHWIDTETQAVLDSLVDSLPAASLLLLVNYRPEYQHLWGSKTYYSQLRLDPLPAESAEEFLRGLLGDDPGLTPPAAGSDRQDRGKPVFSGGERTHAGGDQRAGRRSRGVSPRARRWSGASRLRQAQWQLAAPPSEHGNEYESRREHRPGLRLGHRQRRDPVHRAFRGRCQVRERCHVQRSIEADLQVGDRTELVAEQRASSASASVFATRSARSPVRTKPVRFAFRRSRYNSASVVVSHHDRIVVARSPRRSVRETGSTWGRSSGRRKAQGRCRRRPATCSTSAGVFWGSSGPAPGSCSSRRSSLS